MVTQAKKETKRDYVAEKYSSVGSWGLAFSFFLFELKMYVTGYSREKANGVGRIVNYLEPGPDTVSIQVTLTRRFQLFSADTEGS
jgi:hypothetical protein